MMGSFSSIVSDCSGSGLQNLISWKDARMAPGTSVSEDRETVHVQDIETVEDEVRESRETSDKNNPTQLPDT